MPIGPGACTTKGGSSGNASTTVKVVSDPSTTGAYQPGDVTVPAGQAVTWTWQDPNNQHSVSADDGTFDSCLQGAGYSFTVSFRKPGSYSYKCSIHPRMTGKITVKA
jgi:plastocyanin